MTGAKMKKRNNDGIRNRNSALSMDDDIPFAELSE